MPKLAQLALLRMTTSHLVSNFSMLPAAFALRRTDSGLMDDVFRQVESIRNKHAQKMNRMKVENERLQQQLKACRKELEKEREDKKDARKLEPKLKKVIWLRPLACCGRARSTVSPTPSWP